MEEVAMRAIYWGSRHVDSGRLGILHQNEGVVGYGSAAPFAGEPFGVQQAVGAVLVTSAGLIEVIGNGKGATADEELQTLGCLSGE